MLVGQEKLRENFCLTAPFENRPLTVLTPTFYAVLCRDEDRPLTLPIGWPFWWIRHPWPPKVLRFNCLGLIAYTWPGIFRGFLYVNFAFCDVVRKFWIERKGNPIKLELRLTSVIYESFVFTLIRIPSLVMVTYQITFDKSLLPQSGQRILNQSFSEISNHFTSCSMSGFLKVFTQLLQSTRK